MAPYKFAKGKIRRFAKPKIRQKVLSDEILKAGYTKKVQHHISLPKTKSFAKRNANDKTHHEVPKERRPISRT